MTAKIRKQTIPLLIIFAILLFNKNIYLPKLIDMFNVLVFQKKFICITQELLYSMRTLLIGMLISIILGILISVVYYIKVTIRESTIFIIHFIRNTSTLVMIPIFITILGIGLEFKIFIILWVSIAPIIINTLHGLLLVDKSIIEAARIDGANQIEIIINIAIPSAFSTILTGIDLAFGGAVIAIIASEMMGGNHGIGYYILASAQNFKYAEMYLGIFTIALVGNGIAYCIKKLKRGVFNEEKEFSGIGDSDNRNGFFVSGKK